MKFLPGTSGWSFKEWKGAFYPEGTKDDAMLAHYSSRFPSVEVNNTFYRMPKESVLLGWAEQTPADFRFAVKASQRITHHARLVDAADNVEYFCRVISALGDRRGPSLFQLPPNLKLDLPRLETFLELIPRRWRAAFEFRHPTWFIDPVYEALKRHDCALVYAEQEDFETPLVPTASWGYVRLHKPEYDAATIAERKRAIAAQPWDEAVVFFKHDGDRAGPWAVDVFLNG